MAETDREQRTEEPTEKRMDKALEEGNVAVSTDLTFAVVLLAATAVLALAGERFRAAFANEFAAALQALPHADDGTVLARARDLPMRVLATAAPLLLLVPVLAGTAHVLQVGLHFLPQKLRLRPEKLAPRLEPTRFVNGRSLIDTAVSLLKLVGLIAAVWFGVWGEAPALFALDELAAQGAAGTRLLLRLLLSVGGALLVLGLLDLTLKRRQRLRELRMTKEEVRQEAKDAHGDPEVRARIKRRQREMALRRMMEEVPKASVVVTNPTHFAVALRYVAGMAAPRVVAKGRDLVALRIREIATLAGVPLVENPPLARALHDSAAVGDEVPPTLYQAVAEVLAAVLRARERAGAGRSR